MPQLDFSQLLDPARVLILPGQPSKALTIAALAEIATSSLSAHDRVQFIRAVLEREDVTSTAIGSGVAIPHARTAALDRCRLAVGVLPNGVPWGAADGKPVHLALLIAARESDHAEHLRVMAGLAVRLRKPGLAERLRTTSDRQAIIDALLAF